MTTEPMTLIEALDKYYPQPCPAPDHSCGPEGNCDGECMSYGWWRIARDEILFAARNDGIADLTAERDALRAERDSAVGLLARWTAAYPETNAPTPTTWRQDTLAFLAALAEPTERQEVSLTPFLDELDALDEILEKANRLEETPTEGNETGDDLK